MLVLAGAAAGRQGGWLRVLPARPGQNASAGTSCFLLNINFHKRCLCLNYPKLFSGVSVSDEIVTYGSGKCHFAAFMGARDGNGGPSAGNSSAMGPEK